jgi:hypothetical protein
MTVYSPGEADPSNNASEGASGLQTASKPVTVDICPGWRVVREELQWVLQRFQVPRWRDRAFCRSRSGLELRIRELIGEEHQAAVAHLPDWHHDNDKGD